MGIISFDFRNNTLSIYLFSVRLFCLLMIKKKTNVS